MAKKVVIIQARMSSRRLPGKCMLPLDGKPLIRRVLERVREARNIDNIILATSNDESDDILEYEGKKHGFEVYRGNLNDVLERMYQAAKSSKADIIVRICADNAFVSPELIEKSVEVLESKEYDYVSTMLERTLPAGVNCEVFSFKSFETVRERSTTKYQREHVTPLFYEKNTSFNIKNITGPSHLKRPEIKLSIDNFKDYLVVKRIYKELKPKDGTISIREAILLGDKLELWKINGLPPEVKNKH